MEMDGNELVVLHELRAIVRDFYLVLVDVYYPLGCDFFYENHMLQVGCHEIKVRCHEIIQRIEKKEDSLV